MDFIFKGGVEIDRTPAPPVRRWYYEKHKIFLNGTYTYDESQGSGVVVE
jgi:hypothetical protein